MAVRVVWNGQAVEKRFRAEANRRVKTVVQHCAKTTQRNLKISSRRGSGQSREGSSLGGEWPRASSGALWKSIFADMTGDATGIFGVLKSSPAAKYARRLEEGGIILAHGKYMAVPVSWEAKKWSRDNKGPRTFHQPLVRIKRPGKTMLLVEIPKGRAGERKWIIHYVLTPHVRIAARPYLSRTLMEELPVIKQIFEAPFNL